MLIARIPVDISKKGCHELVEYLWLRHVLECIVLLGLEITGWWCVSANCPVELFSLCTFAVSCALGRCWSHELLG